MEANKDFFSPSDFMIGTTINILNKDFFIFDMDPFTKDFYRLALLVVIELNPIRNISDSINTFNVTIRR